MLIKNITLILLLLIITIEGSQAQGIMGISAKTTRGDSLHFLTLSGKKIVLITLPAGSPGNGLLQELIQFNQHLGDSVSVIGLFSKEDVPAGGLNADSLSAWYGSLTITMLEETFTHPSNAGKFIPLVQWMVSKDLNHYMDQVITVPATKFFLGKTGRLYAVMPPSIPLTGVLMERIMQLNP